MNARRDLRQRESNPFPRVQRMPEAWRKPAQTNKARWQWLLAIVAITAATALAQVFVVYVLPIAWSVK